MVISTLYLAVLYKNCVIVNTKKILAFQIKHYVVQKEQRHSKLHILLWLLCVYDVNNTSAIKKLSDAYSTYSLI